MYRPLVLPPRTAPYRYEIMSPETIGLVRADEAGIVLGKHSGRNALSTRLGQLGFELEEAALNDVFKRFKNLADRKKVSWAVQVVGGLGWRLPQCARGLTQGPRAVCSQRHGGAGNDCRSRSLCLPPHRPRPPASLPPVLGASPTAVFPPPSFHLLSTPFFRLACRTSVTRMCWPW